MITLVIIAAVVAAVLAVVAVKVSIDAKNADATTDFPKELNVQTMIIKQSDFTYDGEKLGEVQNVVVHYTANPGSSAVANRNYFNSLADGHGVSASAHFIIGLDGEIIQCVPLECVSWANGKMESNRHSISIECCHPDDSGKFNEKTLSSLRALVKWLCEKYSLTSDDVIRHYDVTGKDCPRYFVAHPDEWQAFKDSVNPLTSQGK